MNSGHIRYKHRSQWKFIIINDDHERIQIELNDSGRILIPFKKKKYRNLEKYILDQINVSQKEKMTNDQSIPKPISINPELKTRFDENTTEYDSYDIFDDNFIDFHFFCEQKNA